ncbi:putative protein transport protein Sec13 [Trypanosoma theileri]|uniref:Uncharacterized protein n=1 Tax=Trypanosoma theileri TaxID=67003 RepID=A0A1X0NYI1_9TRYP|nr:putative protein transport protein Sec13 [Trypanosoma theileri]ORC89744.1 putative protein transport protein Sec13 [Trypanosoma theileri]
MSETAVASREPTAFDAVLDTGHTAPVTDTAVDAIGKHVASGSEDGTIRIFTADESAPNKWRLLTVLEGHAGPVACVAWAPPVQDAAALLSCGADCHVIVWRDCGAAGGGWAKTYASALQSAPWCCAWAPAEYGRRFAVGCAGGAVVVFNAHDQQWNREEFTAHPNGCCSLAWAPALLPGALLTTPLEAEVQSKGPGGMPIAVPRIVTCGGGRDVSVWTHKSTGNGGSEWIQQLLPVDVEASWREVAWAPTAGMPFTYIAAGSDEGFVVVWSQDGPARGEWNHMLLPQQEDAVTHLSWSHVGTFLLVSCANGTASMWQESSLPQGGWVRMCELEPPISE